MLSCLDIFLKTNRWSLQSGGNTDINLSKLEWITREALVQDRRVYKHALLIGHFLKTATTRPGEILVVPAEFQGRLGGCTSWTLCGTRERKGGKIPDTQLWEQHHNDKRLRDIVPIRCLFCCILCSARAKVNAHLGSQCWQTRKDTQTKPYDGSHCRLSVPASAATALIACFQWSSWNFTT
jgi:hypothetical protein